MQQGIGIAVCVPQTTLSSMMAQDPDVLDNNNK